MAEAVKMRYRLAEQACVDLLRRVRWPEGVVVCLHCGSGDVMRVLRTWRGCYGRWRCRTCGKYFRESTSSQLEHSLLPLHTLFHILECLADGEFQDDIEDEVGLERWAVGRLGPKLLACPVCRAVQRELVRERALALAARDAETARDGVQDAQALRPVDLRLVPEEPEPQPPPLSAREAQELLRRYYVSRILDPGGSEADGGTEAPSER